MSLGLSISNILKYSRGDLPSNGKSRDLESRKEAEKLAEEIAEEIGGTHKNYNKTGEVFSGFTPLNIDGTREFHYRGSTVFAETYETQELLEEKAT